MPVPANSRRLARAIAGAMLLAAFGARAQVPAPPTYPDKPPEGLKPQVNEDEPLPPEPAVED